MPAAGRRNVPAFLGSDVAVIKFLSFWCAPPTAAGARPPACRRLNPNVHPLPAPDDTLSPKTTQLPSRAARGNRIKSLVYG